MNLIQLIACIGLITGCFVLLHISPMDFTEGVFRRITSKPKSIRSEVNESTRRKKKSFLRREIEETQTILRMTGRAAKFPMVCALSLLLFLVGAAFALTLGNLFLVPVLAVGVPTVVDGATLAADLLGTAELPPLGEGRDLLVTPKDIDSQVSDLAKVIGYGIGLALHPGLRVEDLDLLLS